MLVLTIAAVIFAVSYNKDNNKDNIYASKLEDKLWTCIDFNYYNTENVLISEITKYFNVFELKFFDTEVEICIEDSCNISPYEIINDNIIIESIMGYKREFKISFKDDYMFLEYVYEDGNKQIFKFVIPAG